MSGAQIFFQLIHAAGIGVGARSDSQYRFESALKMERTLVELTSQLCHNVTGNATLVGQSLSKSLEILVATVGTGHAIARITPSTFRVLPTFSLEHEMLLATARTLNTRFSHVEVDTLQALDVALDRLVRQGVQGVIFDQDESWWPERRHIAEMLIRRRLPAISDDPEFASAGLLLSYSANQEELCRRSAAYVDQHPARRATG